MVGIICSIVRDGGPIYWETGKGILFVEDWNAFSSLLYLIPALLLLIKIRKSKKRFYFIEFFAAPLLFIGGIGSTLYHAFRSEYWLMMLDVVPIFILTLGIATYFLYRWINNFIFALVVTILFMALRFMVFEWFDLQTAINISYFIVGTLMFVPAFFFAKKMHFKGIGFLLVSILFLAMALLFRFIDDYSEVSVSHGTHWLWHLFSAGGSYWLGLYLYHTRKITLQKTSINR